MGFSPFDFDFDFSLDLDFGGINLNPGAGYTQYPDVNYKTTVVNDLENKKVDFETIWVEESKGFLDDPDKKTKSETIHLRKDINRITNIFLDAYTGQDVDAEYSTDYNDAETAVNDKADKLNDIAAKFPEFSQSRAKEKIEQGRDVFKEYWLQNVYSQKSARRRNRRIDGYNTGRGEKEELSSKTKTHQPMGTAQINSERLGSTPETEADSVKLGS